MSELHFAAVLKKAIAEKGTVTVTLTTDPKQLGDTKLLMLTEEPIRVTFAYAQAELKAFDDMSPGEKAQVKDKLQEKLNDEFQDADTDAL